jgi:hypothetical protein
MTQSLLRFFRTLTILMHCTSYLNPVGDRFRQGEPGAGLQAAACKIIPCSMGYVTSEIGLNRKYRLTLQ